MLFSFVSLTLEVVLCFVVVDFVVSQRSWTVLAVAFGAGLVESWRNAKLVRGKAASVKQGGYGKIQVYKDSLLKQLSYPTEILAMVRCKMVFKSNGSTLGEGVKDELELDLSDLAFCEVKLNQVSRSFAQVITFLPNSPKAPLRLAVAVFYLVLRALDTVEDDMELRRFDDYVLACDKQQSLAGEDCRLKAKQRLLRGFAQRISDAMKGAEPCEGQEMLIGFGEGDERELVENLDILVRVIACLPPQLAAVILDITEEMGNGMADYIARDLKNGTQDAIDFENYCHIAAGTVGDGLTRLFAGCGLCSSALTQRRDLWDSMGSFLQRVNIIRDYLEDMVDGRAWWPKSVWELYVPKDYQFGRQPSISALAQRESIENGQSLACLEHMIADALQLVPSCMAYLEALGDDARVLSFCALPQAMAIATLAECYTNPKVFMGVVKIRKGLAAKIIFNLAPIKSRSAADLRANTVDLFTLFINNVLDKALTNEFPTAETDRIVKTCQNLKATVLAQACATGKRSVRD